MPTLTTPPSATKEIEKATSTPDFIATNYALTSTAIVQAILTKQSPRVYDTYPSPDGQWLVEINTYDCIEINPGENADKNAFEQLQLTDISSGQKKLADSQLQYCGGLGAFGLEGLFWSPNSRYFYYTDARQGVPDGCGFWERPILQLDPRTLKVEELGGGPASPDGTKLAVWHGKELLIWDLQEGQKIGAISPHVFNIETGTGPIVWSPDSRALVYIQAESYCPLSGSSEIVQVDLPALAQAVLLKSEPLAFSGASWNQANELRLVDQNGKVWVYMFDTQQLKPLP